MNQEELTIEEIHRDNRGFLRLIKFKGKEYLLSYTLKGASRGGYFFKRDRIYAVLNGSLLFREMNLQTQKEVEKTIKTGDHFTITPGNAHLFTALEDSFMIELTPDAEEKAEMIPYEPYRKLIKI